MHKLLQRVKVKVASRLAREQACGGGEGLEVGDEEAGEGGDVLQGWGGEGGGGVETEGSEWKFAVDEVNSKDIMIQVIMVTHYV